MDRVPQNLAAKREMNFREVLAERIRAHEKAIFSLHQLEKALPAHLNGDADWAMRKMLETA